MRKINFGVSFLSKNEFSKKVDLLAEIVCSKSFPTDFVVRYWKLKEKC